MLKVKSQAMKAREKREVQSLTDQNEEKSLMLTSIWIMDENMTDAQ